MSESLISLVMSLKDYETWTNDDESFIRIFIHRDGIVTYSMTDYDRLWNECLYCLKDEEKQGLYKLDEESYSIRKKELFSDFIMKTDAYSYVDYISSESFVPNICINQIGFQYFYSLIFGNYSDEGA